MTEVIVGWLPQSGQAGSGGTLIFRNVVFKASYNNRLPDRLSPSPSSSFNASVACVVPITPAIDPKMPAVSQLAVVPGGGGLGNRQR